MWRWSLKVRKKGEKHDVVINHEQYSWKVQVITDMRHTLAVVTVHNTSPRYALIRRA